MAFPMAFGSDEVEQWGSGGATPDRTPQLRRRTFLEHLPQLLDEPRYLGFSVRVEPGFART
jgi:hypothetical protein